MQPGLRQLLFNSDPYPGASLVADFVGARTGSHFFKIGGKRSSLFSSSVFPGLAISRSSVGYAETLGGKLVLFQPNQPRWTDKGLLVEEARTNKCTNTSVNPASLTNVTKSGDAAAVLSVVDDSAALAGIGLSGNVFKLDNSAGVAEGIAEFGGQVGNTNSHVASIYVRGGSGRLLDSGGGGPQTFGASSTYRRIVTPAYTPGATTRQMRVRADAGQIIYFILNQLEEGSFVTSPISVAGATATRAADNISVGGLNLPQGITLATEFLTDVVHPSATRRIANLADAADADRNAITITQSAQTVRVSDEAGSTPSGNSFTLGAAARAAAMFNATEGRLSLNGGAVVSGAYPAANDLVNLHLGSLAGSSSFLNGFIRRVVLYPRAFSDSELIAATQ